MSQPASNWGHANATVRVSDVTCDAAIEWLRRITTANGYGWDTDVVPSTFVRVAVLGHEPVEPFAKRWLEDVANGESKVHRSLMHKRWAERLLVELEGR